MKCFQKSLWKGASGGLIDQRSLHLVISCLQTVSQLSDFKEVFDRLFWTLIKTRKLKKWIAFKWENFPDQSSINQGPFFLASHLCCTLKNVFCMNYTSPPPFFMNTHCIVGSPEGKHFKNGSNLSHFTFHFSNCCIFRVKTMRKNSDTERDKSAEYKFKLRHDKWLLRVTKSL